MKHSVLGLAVLMAASVACWAADKSPTSVGIVETEQTSAAAAATADDAPIRERLRSYLDVFNQHNAEALASFWAEDAVSVNQETGEETVGRMVLQQDFDAFFQDTPTARLIGEVDTIRMIRPDVATIKGRTTMFVDDAEPIETAFSALLVKQGDQWLISSSNEYDIPTPPTPYDALRELEFLVGTWQDDTDDTLVHTTVRWSPHRAFLIRSFSAHFEDGGPSEGTQVIGWDPLNKQVRTWTFHSDGSFGEGTASKNGDGWMVKMSQVLSDGRVSAATQIITRVDGDTITVHTIGQTLDGEPVPASDPVTVVRVTDAEADPADEAAPDAAETDPNEPATSPNEGGTR